MIRDDFHGAGGWHVALMMLGCTEQTLGVEMEPHPVATARAAGATVIRADVRHLRGDALGRPRLYIASPPCQTYSPAGKRAGIATLPLILAAVQLVADGETPERAVDRVNVSGADLDERSMLVLHPLEVIRDTLPDAIALEQVRSVLPVWQAYSTALEGMGYSVATGVLHSEQYGVPQTRDRAILVARRDGIPARLPEPTHSRYYSRDPGRQDLGVEPWVSMAAA